MSKLPALSQEHATLEGVARSSESFAHLFAPLYRDTVNSLQSQYIAPFLKSKGFTEAQAKLSTSSAMSPLSRLMKTVMQPLESSTSSQTGIPFGLAANAITTVSSIKLPISPLQLAQDMRKLKSVACLMEALRQEANIRCIDEVWKVSMELGFVMTAVLLLPMVSAEAMASIRVVNLESLNLPTLPKFMSKLPRLQMLNLRNNQIDLLPSHLHRHDDIKLDGNPLRTLPPAVACSSWPEIRQYLQALERQAERWGTFRVLSLCEKTIAAPAAALLKKALDMKDDTGGLVRKSHAEGALSLPKTGLTATLSTSGNNTLYLTLNLSVKQVAVGEEKLQLYSLCAGTANHPFTWSTLLSPARKIALFVDLSSRTVQATLSHNMKLLMKRFFYMDLMVVCLLPSSTPPEGEGDHAATVAWIETTYPRAKVVVTYGARQSDAARSVRSWLGDFPASTRTVPLPWVRLYDLVVSKAVEEKFVSSKVLSTWAFDCGLGTAELGDAIEFLECSGALLMVGVEDLGNIAILDADWLCTVLQQASEVVEGVLKMTSVKKQLELPPGCNLKNVLSIMQSLEMVVGTAINNDAPVLVVPHSLPETMPNIGDYWMVKEATAEYRRIFRLSFTPTELFSRLLVRALQLNDLVCYPLWTTGAVIKHRTKPEQVALVTFNHSAGELHIKARNAKANAKVSHDLFFHIVGLVTSVMQNHYPHIQVDSLIPCAHCLAQDVVTNPYHFFLKDLIAEMTAGSPFVYCNNIRSPSRCVQISKLAPDIAFSNFKSISATEIEIEKELARGSFGKVLKGVWKGHTVAVKEPILDDSMDRNDQIQTFKDLWDEANIMSYLESPFLVRMFGVSDKPLRLVMEFIPHGDLFHFLHANGEGAAREPIPMIMKLKLALDIARGMNYLQSISPPIIHRDLRSPNVFINALDHTAPVCAKVADFGLSKQLAGGKVEGSLQSWQWLAPEVISGESYDHRSDIYSFAMVVFEILAQEVPFDAQIDKFSRKIYEPDGTVKKYPDVFLVKDAIINHNLQPDIPKDCPQDLADLLRKCWSRSVAERPPFSAIVQCMKQIFIDHGGTVDENDENEALMNIPISNNTPQPEAADDMLAAHYETLTSTMSQPSSSAGTEAGSPCSIRELCDVETTGDSVFTLLTSRITQEVWAGFENGTVAVFDSKTHSLIWKSTPHTNRVFAFLQYEEYIFSLEEKGCVMLWNCTTYRQIATFQILTEPASCALMSPQNEIWVGFPLIGEVWVWPVAELMSQSLLSDGLPLTTRPVAKLRMLCDKGTHRIKDIIKRNKRDPQRRPFSVTAMEYLANRVWIGCQSTIFVVEAFSTRRLVSAFELDGKKNATVLSHVQQGDKPARLCVGTVEGTIFMYDSLTIELVAQNSCQQSKIMSIRSSKRHMVSASSSGDLILWDRQSLTPLFESCHPKNKGLRSILLIAPDSLWAVTRAGTITVYSLTSGEHAGGKPHRPASSSLTAFTGSSPSHKRLPERQPMLGAIRISTSSNDLKLPPASEGTPDGAPPDPELGAGGGGGGSGGGGVSLPSSLRAMLADRKYARATKSLRKMGLLGRRSTETGIEAAEPTSDRDYKLRLWLEVERQRIELTRWVEGMSEHLGLSPEADMERALRNVFQAHSALEQSLKALDSAPSSSFSPDKISN